MPVERVTEVRSAQELTPLPEPRDGVAGLMRREDTTITVLSMVDAGGAHVVVVEDGSLTFGLLVDEVTGVLRVGDDSIGPAPAGQDGALVDGIVTDGDALVLLLDVGALARRLTT